MVNIKEADTRSMVCSKQDWDQAQSGQRVKSFLSPGQSGGSSADIQEALSRVSGQPGLPKIHFQLPGNGVLPSLGLSGSTMS